MDPFHSYFLASAGDKRDLSHAIEEKLKTYGTCLLGTGDYYVSGVTMPADTAILGMGSATRIILMDEVESGYAIRLGTRCTVKCLSVLGSAEELPRPAEVGTRHGIGFLGTATTKDWSGQIRNCILHSLFIRSFSGGGITCTDTGYSSCCSMTVSDCHVTSCGAGINITHYSEYHKFSNVHCTANLYGCINNGGNNTFSSCAFDSNIVGFLMDNSQGQSPNNSHGNVVGCTFNHTDSNKGVGIMALGTKSGYVFSACQIFYSKIYLEGCSGLQFSNFNCGRNLEITVKDCDMTLFTGLITEKDPHMTVENSTVCVRDCYNRAGEPIFTPPGEKASPVKNYSI